MHRSGRATAAMPNGPTEHDGRAILTHPGDGLPIWLRNTLVGPRRRIPMRIQSSNGPACRSLGTPTLMIATAGRNRPCEHTADLLHLAISSLPYRLPRSPLFLLLSGRIRTGRRMEQMIAPPTEIRPTLD